MESLKENRPLMFSVIGSTACIFALALGVFPEVAQQFEIVDFPLEVSNIYENTVVLAQQCMIYFSKIF